MSSESPEAVGLSVRGLMRSLTRGALGTLEVEGAGPYVSLVMVALDHDASPLMLLSDLADHTRNLRADPRASLLFDATLDRAVPLAGERVTVQGRVECVARDDPERPRLLARYVARHPDAEGYAGFGDFNLYRMGVERAHLVAGFGRIHWVEGGAVRLGTAGTRALAEAEPRVVAHMNEDHADAVALYAERLLGRAGGGGWRMTGIDPEGIDLRAGGAIARLPFSGRVATPQEARAELVRLARSARER
jgi:heme iron utilization protein